MSDNLYFKTNQFDSTKSLAEFMHSELSRQECNPALPANQDYMYSITPYVENVAVNFYMGKNDEKSNPTLWQI